MRWQINLARPEQLPPEGTWSNWLYIAGRGAGKTRTAAEWLAYKAVTNPNTRWAVVAPTFSDARDTCLEGESGLVIILNRYGVLDQYNRSQGAVTLDNGSRIKIFSGEEPERLRGPQHHGAWVDELAAFRYDQETWDQLQFGLRLGEHPQVVVTTTPKPRGLLKDLMKRSDGTVVITRGSTFDNAANLAPTALLELRARYEGTTLGKQELYGEMIDVVDGALFTRQQIDDNRADKPIGRIMSTVVSVDPAVTNNDSSDETGIVVCASDDQGNGYVLADLTMKGRPDQWARATIDAFDQWKCDCIVVEVNQGGDMVAQTLRTVRSLLPIKEVRATKGKRLRAEPIAAMYEQGRIHHLGTFPQLEDQMCTWVPDDGKSPDRLDAMVHGFTYLTSRGMSQGFIAQMGIMCEACGTPNIRGSVSCVSCGSTLKVEHGIA
jgi:phage terminase large subunit-like protein